MKDEQAPVHQLDHAEPTVIHHPEEDMTVLGRWLRRGMEQGTRFWLLMGGALLVLVALATLSSGLAASKSAEGKAWSELTQAKTVEDRIKVAEAHPKTPVAGWAKLYSAQEEYANGVDDLTTPGKKELAGPRLAKALKLFEEVARDAGKDTSQALGGLFGAARTLEARNELDEAIKKYRELAGRFPDAPEGKQSLELAKALEDPLNRTFYKELYAYQPKAAASPIPGLGEGFGGLGNPSSLFPAPTGPASPAGPGSGSGPAQPPRVSSPENLTPPAGLDAPPPTAPTPAAGPALEPPKAAAPKADEKPAPTPPPAATPAPAEATKPSPPK